MLMLNVCFRWSVVYYVQTHVGFATDVYHANSYASVLLAVILLFVRLSVHDTRAL